jgi:hypothetical protein
MYKKQEELNININTCINCEKGMCKIQNTDNDIYKNPNKEYVLRVEEKS